MVFKKPIIMDSQGKFSLHNRFSNHKRTVLTLLLIFSGLAVLIFAVVNYFREKYLLFSIELIGSCLSFLLLYWLIKNPGFKRFQHIALAYVLLFCLFLVLVFASLEVYMTAYVFVLLMPLIAHLLLGCRLGFIITAIFLMSSAIIFINQYQGHVILTERLGFYNVVIVTTLVWILAFSYERANEHVRADLIHQASHDFLTGLYNRTMLNDIYRHKLNKSINHNKPLSMFVADLDYFKKINDLYGHKAGDEFIREFAVILNKLAGPNSACFRFGGEEFCVILASTDQQNCRQVAENIRRATENIRLKTDHQDITVTVSMGMATCYDKNCEMSDLLKIADKNLYKAKQQGRNRVVG